ncbi:hypothetical protein J7T55_003197 [Diaporthe amygdali]|uniref:uncharacterized protein n=1 Tax=Phomopsis amygdali TaxID=1214568 RepID=UPI0022FE5D66|nr:uncharacterized protein J7T55_003197 [Diaporthe amygdali]KAJ0122681.1 hypothetical protein J7T55_003197 [Diaporthe amygdali]
MASKSSFLPRLSLSRPDNSSILPFHNSTSRYPALRNQRSEYDLDELSPQAERDGLISPAFDGPAPSILPSNRKPTGALNRRPSNSSTGSTDAKIRKERGPGRIMFAGPPPPIAMSTVLYRDAEARYDDGEEAEEAGTASWLPGTARKAIRSVMWDRSSVDPARRPDEAPVVYDRNSIWRSLQRRERAIVQDVQQYLQIQEGILTRARPSDDGDEHSSGSATPTSASVSSSRRLHRSIIEPVTRSGPGGEIIPVRQPKQKKAGISDARKGIAGSMAQLANLKVEEDASILSALSIRKQALVKLRNLSTKHDDIAGELTALETDEAEPLARELEELGSEHRGVCSEIEELQKRLTELRTRRRYLERRMDGVQNRREAGLSGYKNALKEIEDATNTFLTRPPVKPLDVEALTVSTNKEEPRSTPGGVEFMHLRPERRTIDMAREWWEGEVSILEQRKAQVEVERAALEEGGQIWDEVVSLVLDFETQLRKLMAGVMASSVHGGKGKEREIPPKETILKLQYEKINTVVMGLEQRLRVAEEKGWNLLIAAIGAELEAFKQAQKINRDMLKEAGIVPDDQSSNDLSRENSGMTGSTNNSFHTVNGGSTNLKDIQEQLLDIPNNHEDERTDESDNEVPADLLVAQPDSPGGGHRDDGGNVDGANEGPSMDRENSDNEVPLEFLVEHHDSRE